MPRPLRHIVANEIYHVLNRGNGRRRIFWKPQDYQSFLKVLAEGLSRFKVELLAWCVMPNHWHLIVKPRGAGQLEAFMQWITVTHVRRYHEHRRGRGGHLYQGRYKHFCVEEDSYFLTLCRYVEANALRAKLVKRAQEWAWSSLHQRAGGGVEPPLSEWPVDRPGEWTRLVNEAMGEPELKQVRECVVRDRPLGTPLWVRRMAAKLGVEQTLRQRGRPRKSLEELSARQRRRRQSEQAGQNGT